MKTKMTFVYFFRLLVQFHKLHSNHLLQYNVAITSGAGTVGHERARAPPLSEVAGLRAGVVPHF
jgi:hypothetical protein